MFNEYLQERAVTPHSLESMSRCLLQIKKDIAGLDRIIFLNLLRGSIIPTMILQNIMDRDSMIINIPASCDEVSNSAVFEIFKIYLKRADIENSHIVWIDEAYSGRMGANISILLVDLLKTLKASSFSIFFIADSKGAYIKKDYSAVLDRLSNDFENFVKIRTIGVISLHWMDNIDLIGINWGRRYACIEKDIIESLRDYSYRILRESTDTHDYLVQYKKARSINPEGKLYHLDDYYYDPHTLWCKNASEYKEKYSSIESDPTVLIQFSLKKRNDYIKLLTDIMHGNGNQNYGNKV